MVRWSHALVSTKIASFFLPILLVPSFFSVRVLHGSLKKSPEKNIKWIYLQYWLVRWSHALVSTKIASFFYRFFGTFVFLRLIEFYMVPLEKKSWKKNQMNFLNNIDWFDDPTIHVCILIDFSSISMTIFITTEYLRKYLLQHSKTR